MWLIHLTARAGAKLLLQALNRAGASYGARNINNCHYLCGQNGPQLHIIWLARLASLSLTKENFQNM